MLIVSDTTPLISLLKAGQIALLQRMFEKIIIPDAVYQELTRNPAYSDEAVIIKESDYICVEHVKNIESVKILRNVTGLDAGESEAIVLMDERKADLLLIDEHKGRQVAKQMGMSLTGTIGILLRSYDKGFLTDKEVEACLNILKDNKIHISKALYDLIYEHIKS